MSDNIPRQPAGSPQGGQFAATGHTEADVDLGGTGNQERTRAIADYLNVYAGDDFEFEQDADLVSMRAGRLHTHIDTTGDTPVIVDEMGTPAEDQDAAWREAEEAGNYDNTTHLDHLVAFAAGHADGREWTRSDQRPDRDYYQWPSGVPRDEAIVAYDDDRGIYEYGSGMILEKSLTTLPTSIETNRNALGTVSASRLFQNVDYSDDGDGDPKLYARLRGVPAAMIVPLNNLDMEKVRKGAETRVHGHYMNQNLRSAFRSATGAVYEDEDGTLAFRTSGGRGGTFGRIRRDNLGRVKFTWFEDADGTRSTGDDVDQEKALKAVSRRGLTSEKLNDAYQKSDAALAQWRKSLDEPMEGSAL